jgi:hypothetical protein
VLNIALQKLHSKKTFSTLLCLRAMHFHSQRKYFRSESEKEENFISTPCGVSEISSQVKLVGLYTHAEGERDSRKKSIKAH